MLWGSASSAIKLSYQAFNLDTSNAYNLLLFAGVRFFGAGWLTLLLSRLINHQTPHFHKSMILPSLGIAIMQTGLQYFLFYIGLAVVSSASSAILHASSPFIAVILAAAVGLEVLTGRKLFAILLGLVGIVILNVGSNFEFAFRWNGELFILLSAACNALGNLLIKHFGRKHEPVTLTGFQFIIGGAILSLLGYWGGGRLSWPGFGKNLLLVHLMLISSIAYGLWSILLKQHDVSKVVIFQSLIPVFATLFSRLRLNENIWRWQTLIALLLVVSGIFILNIPFKHKEQKQKIRHADHRPV